MRALFLIMALMVTTLAGQAVAEDKLAAVIAGPQRSAENAARDAARHPQAVLSFMGLQDGMTVVEVSPGAKMWWTEILAPYLKDHGRYYLALAGFETEAVKARMAAEPALYGRMMLTSVAEPAPPASADMVLTFRNLHNWMAKGRQEEVLKGFFQALKPGGILGLSDHRAAAGQEADPKAGSGYVSEDYAVALVEKVGFKLLARSEVNANPKDSKDYPGGVWSLPPTFALKDADRERYAAIGEADEFTLKFVKP